MLVTWMMATFFVAGTAAQTTQREMKAARERKAARRSLPPPSVGAMVEPHPVTD